MLHPKRRATRELWMLGSSTAGVAFCFSVGTNQLMRSHSIRTELQAIENVPPQAAAKWEEKSQDAFTLGIVMLGIGVVCVVAVLKAGSLLRSQPTVP
jgi:hypothetical protein